MDTVRMSITWLGVGNQFHFNSIKSTCSDRSIATSVCFTNACLEKV